MINLFNYSQGKNISDRRTKAFREFKRKLYIKPMTRVEFVRKYGADGWSETAYQRYLSTLNKELK
ncbi:MAG TPA: hypothetical protein VMV32_06165 [Ignavibacteriaceae bacterium]|nr:hypothetical protein [Ignavibacteriaceae bacterium]